MQAIACNVKGWVKEFINFTNDSHTDWLETRFGKRPSEKFQNPQSLNFAAWSF